MTMHPDGWADDNEPEHADLLAFYEERAMTEYLIWDVEQGMWWGPSRQGHTTDVDRAGRYSAREAGDLVINYIPPGSLVACLASIAGNCVGMLKRRTA